ncbi:MAG: 23S rRNA (guanosine(2251)-2'-O)-methyltransferase RlmB [Gammaproteobacteria bacterium]|nr:23S rRNA (guanosine(2251)-2'-O)-methyltransferase RlmB [Gammaproteobacteria bacterium]
MSNRQLIYGIHAVEAAIQRDATKVKSLWVDRKRHDKRLESLVEAAYAAQLQPTTLNKDELTKMAGVDRHQGVVAEVIMQQAGSESTLETILTELEEAPFLLVLDGVQDPHNLGACLRSAEAAGVHAVIAPKDKACGLTATVRKVSSGASEQIPFILVTNLARTLRQLQDNGVWVVGTALHDDSRSLYESDLKGPLALVLGAEGKGIRRLTAETCDGLIHIPMAGTVESLNVSVATGITLFEALRQRKLQSS